MNALKQIALGAVLVASPLVLTACSTAPKSEVARDNLREESELSLRKLKSTDATLDDFLRRGYGYVVFPEVGKGGLIVGGAYGRGIAYEQGQMVGYADIAQADVGLQAGGQSFTEVLVFENKAAMDNFKYGRLKFGANASAVAMKAGAAAATQFKDGVAVFTQPIGGLMFEASVGGQSFTYRPTQDVEPATRPVR
jgi:lipid-binding SYLF domain-containing protein